MSWVILGRRVVQSISSSGRTSGRKASKQLYSQSLSRPSLRSVHSTTSTLPTRSSVAALIAAVAVGSLGVTASLHAQTEGQTDKQTDIQTDNQTDNQKHKQDSIKETSQTQKEDEETEEKSETGTTEEEEEEEVLGEFMTGPGYFPEGLTILDKNSAESLLRSPDVDVVVAVIAKGCSICKLFKLVYEQVAASLSQDPVIVALIDGTDYDPVGFTEEESQKIPRIRIYKKHTNPSDSESGVLYQERTVGPKDLLNFIKQHTTSPEKIDFEKAEKFIESTIDVTKEALLRASHESVDEEAKTSMTLKMSNLSPCADKLRELYIQWTLRDYPAYSEYEEKFKNAMTCLRSQENEDFWVDVVDVATDNLRVIDKAQEKEKRDDESGAKSSKSSKSSDEVEEKKGNDDRDEK